MIELKPDQEVTVAKLRKRMGQGVRSILLRGEVGSGKTVMTSYIASKIIEKGNTFMMVAPRRVLVEQISDTFKNFGINHSFVAAGYKYKQDSNAWVASLDTLIGRLNHIAIPSVVAIDECFPKGTMIKTPSGEKDIAEVSLNDVVYNATGLGLVTAKSVKKETVIYNIGLSDGTKIRTTKRHPFFTKRGWVRCCELDLGDEFFALQDMPVLWDALQTEEEIQKSERRGNKKRVLSKFKRVYSKKVLLNQLLEEDGELHEKSNYKGSRICDIKKNRTQAICSWWKRQGLHNTTKNDDGNDGNGLDSRDGDSYQKAKMGESLPDLLQGRFGKQKLDGRNRNRWIVSQFIQAKSERHKEGFIPCVKRVESIEIQELPCGENVYNLEVNRHPSFFANGVLVHNCHHGSVGLDTVIRFFKSKGCWIIGLSATPWKLSGKGLGCWYDDMVHGPSMKELIAMGRLSDYRPFSPSKVDLKGLRSQSGDYAKNQLNDRFGNDKKLIGDIVGHYKKHALGKLGITFAVSIDASKRLAQAYRDAGVPAMHIDGTTPDDDRKKIIRAYARRELHQLTNCNLLSFGFDLSSASGGMDVTIECMSDGTPTMSLSNQRQKWGRVLRKKDHPALIFDHVNNFEEHGYPDDDIEWTLEDREKKKRNDDGERLLPVRTCPECQFSHRPTPSCPNCGFTYPVIGRDLEQVEGELHEIQIRQEKKEKRMEVGKARTPQEKIAIEKERGYKKGWAYNQCLATRIISREMTFYDFYKRYSHD